MSMIGARTNNRITLPMPHKGQRVVRKQARRFNWLAAGRRWRKTTLAMTICVEEAVRSARLIWGAPTYDQVRVAWDETHRALHNTADFNQQRMMVTLPTGGVILYRSLDNPDNARGHSADGLVVDEASEVKAAAWYEVLRPMLIDTGGWAWFIYTPKGRRWTWQEHVKAADDADSRAWQVPTVGCEIVDGQLIRKPHPLENPFIPFEEIQHLYETMPERSFRQEILAEFVDDGGEVFRNVRKCVDDKLNTVEPYTGDFVAGVDWAQQVDFSVITVMDRVTRKVVDIDRFNRVDWALQRQRIMTMRDKWKPRYITCEINSIGSPNFEALQREGLPVYAFETTASSKPPLIESLVLAFERSEIGIPDNPVLIGELEAYERKVSAVTGRSSYSAPDGMHDDCVMSLALAWREVMRGVPTSGRNPFFED